MSDQLPVALQPANTKPEVSSQTTSQEVSPSEVIPLPPDAEKERAIWDRNEVEKLKKQMQMFVEIGTLIIVAVFAINLLLMFLIEKQIAQYRINRQQISAALYNSSDIQNTVSFLEEQKQQTEIINNALPNEVGFIEFVRTLELIASQHSKDSQFEFEKGTADNGIPYVPLKINMTTDASNFTEFLKKVEKVPYLLQFNKIDVMKVLEGENLWL